MKNGIHFYGPWAWYDQTLIKFNLRRRIWKYVMVEDVDYSNFKLTLVDEFGKYVKCYQLNIRWSRAYLRIW